MNDGKPTCLWNTRTPQYTKETVDFLKTLMTEAKISNQIRRDIQRNVQNGQPLPSKFPGSKQNHTRKPSHPMERRQVRPGLRTRETIIASGAYDMPKPKPLPLLKDRQVEKERLANIFAYGTDLAKEFEKFKAQKARRREAAAKSEQVEIDRFDELFEELKDRKRFLDEMYELGRGREYAPMIETEISQIIREMELIDKKKSVEGKT
nr:unnamed protein product [Spirometra erinaceieuropaei]